MKGLSEKERQRIAAGNRSHSLRLRDGAVVPLLGQGTWHMGEKPQTQRQEAEALRLGVELGMTLIDTAEMYAEGGAERTVGEAIRGIRDQVFLVSKIYPYNASMPMLREKCEQSLRRMKTDVLDLYLLHWRGNIPLEKTVEGMEQLVRQGKIKRWGVSNFDLRDMEQLFAVPGGKHCAVNQVLYNLGSRGIEYSLLPWMRAHGVALMAYCPLAQAGQLRQDMFGHPAVQRIAQEKGVSPLQVILAWCLSQDAITIPKATLVPHVVQNAQTGLLTLSEDERKALSAAFPAPVRKIPLDIQ